MRKALPLPNLCAPPAGLAGILVEGGGGGGGWARRRSKTGRTGASFLPILTDSSLQGDGCNSREQ